MTNEDELVSERIHDADSETNENMVHWLHQLTMGKITIEKLGEIFFNAYLKHESIKPPWKS
jgi:hypothetical protein